VGLIARAIEAEGISTICLSSLKPIAEQVRPPRTLHLAWPFGHPLGEPGNIAQQLTVLHAALYSLYFAEPGEILEPGWRWRRETYTVPDGWDLPEEAPAAGQAGESRPRRR
jgi:D-proline reductase (dithiol) PrdB